MNDSFELCCKTLEDIADTVERFTDDGIDSSETAEDIFVCVKRIRMLASDLNMQLIAADAYWKAESAAGNARIAELEAMISDVENWQECGEDIERKYGFRTAFKIGAWWADRPWRDNWQRVAWRYKDSSAEHLQAPK